MCPHVNFTPAKELDNEPSNRLPTPSAHPERTRLDEHQQTSAGLQLGSCLKRRDSQMSTLVQAQNLVKVYGNGNKPAVNDVSFDIQQGELFVIMGLSGSGKSTVLRMLNRLIDATSGKLLIGGENLLEMSAKRLREVRNGTINMVFQHFAIFPHRTVLDNAAYGLKVRGVSKEEREERAKKALETVGLGDWLHRYPSNLSGGMRQRVGLARALATDAEILLMDEPFSALDPMIRRSMQDLLLHLQNELKKTIVFVTHDLNEAMRLGDRIMVMRDGGIVQLGTAEQILNAPADDYVAEFIGDVDRSRVVTARAALEAPRFTATLAQSPPEVLTEMERSGLEAAYVLNEKRQVLGTITYSTLQTSPHPDMWHGLLSDDFDLVPAQTPLNECFQLVGGHAVPLGVIDADRRLLGVLPRAALLSTLSNRKADSHANA
jgi:glycine betaine/proline transport system ATP-binding protein